MTNTAQRGEQSGEKRRLAADSLGPLSVLGIAMAAISPTTSVFLVYGEGLAHAGTGLVWAFVLGAAIAVSMACCYAEVGSVFPSAGGAYTIVRRALGPIPGGVVTVLFLVLGCVSTASILTSAATYLSQVAGGQLPVNWVAAAMMLVITALSAARVSPAGWVAVAMLVIEVAAILAFTGFAFAGQVHPAAAFTHPSTVDGSGLLGGLLAAVVPALFAFNGYDWPLYFAEETRAARRALPRAVLLAAGLCILLEVAAVVAATGAIRDLPAVAAADAPLSVLARQVMGPVGAQLLLACVVVAMFDTGLAANLGYSRILYAAGRDRMWPGPVNRFFGHVTARTRVPGAALAVLAAGNLLLCLVSSLGALITFTGVVIVAVYALVAVSALVVRVRDRGRAGSFRMPLWPLPPLVALAGIGLAVSQQHLDNLIITGVIVAVALIGYLAARRALPGRLEGVD